MLRTVALSPRTRRTAAVLTLTGLALAVAGPAAAHAKWFAEGADGGDWGFFLSPLPLAVTAAVVVVTVLWRLVSHRLPRPELPFLTPLGRLAPFIPRLVAIHMGVSLLAFSVTGHFLTPSLPLGEVPGGDFAGVVQAAIGIWLITGIRLRIPALGVVLLGPPALLAAGPVALLETADTLAVALFLAVLPPSDRAFGRVAPSPQQLRWALFWLRMFVGIALITLAFSEKFTNPELARNLLEAYPELNLFALVGLPVDADTFIVMAGAIELLFGLLVISGAMPQVAVLVALVPFNLTLFIFGTTEVIGHLPVYGVFLALLVYGSHRESAAAVPWFPRPADWRALVTRDPASRAADTPRDQRESQGAA
ncbi:hypothetical protein [Cellulomonas bogoriensis]|uniref:DoxX family protein n=1 Tax=Cellulomonas bogoriensis 69B4 = DSM 16987 TaxID=1386082 RepID=A0A0A0BMG5_9CELL|nr:hypothetical protein [Cellulomonas bogoriensis]KGM09110.1 hypothetical protein N869_01085 [Cellulomonas bogoriensis 69B4 = DSM 16987]